MPAIFARDRLGAGDGEDEESEDEDSGDGEGVDSGSDTDVYRVNSITSPLYPFSLRLFELLSVSRGLNRAKYSVYQGAASPQTQKVGVRNARCPPPL